MAVKIGEVEVGCRHMCEWRDDDGALIREIVRVIKKLGIGSATCSAPVEEAEKGEFPRPTEYDHYVQVETESANRFCVKTSQN